MDINKIRKKVNEVVTITAGKRLPPHAILSEHLDSLDIVELTLELEESFVIDISDNDIDACNLVHDLYQLIDSKIK